MLNLFQAAIKKHSILLDLYKENHLLVSNKYIKHFISAFGIAVAPALTALEPEQVQAQALANPLPAPDYSAGGEQTGTSATSANPDPTRHEPTGTSAASANPDPTHYEPTGTSAASAIHELTRCEPTGATVASVFRDSIHHEQTGLVLHQLSGSQHTVSQLVLVLHQLFVCQYTIGKLVLACISYS